MVIEVAKRRKYVMEVAGIRMAFVFDEDCSMDMEDVPSAPVDTVEISLRVHKGRLPGNGTGVKIFDSHAGWSLCRRENHYVLQGDSLESGSLPETTIVLDSDFTSGDVYKTGVTGDPDVDPLGGHPLALVLMIMLLSRGRGVLLHACGIIDNERGYLFLGNSTHGKSTMAQLWHERNATILNDDRIIVRERNGEFWMYGTPWHGTFPASSPSGVPIDAIFFLHHGETNHVVPRSGAAAAAMLLTRSFPPFWDRQGMDFTLAFLARMERSCACHELHFLPDETIIQYLRGMQL